MNKVITINLGGNAYQLEEGGYETLRAYLENATARLQGNPDKDEIFSDIERAIAEKFRTLLASHKTVVETKEVSAVIAEMGPIETDASQAAGPEAGSADASGSANKQGAAKEEQTASPGWTPRRLYRIREGAKISGVCNGIAAYLNVDPTFVRLAFLLLLMLGGSGILVYIVLVFVIPEAVTPEQKAAAFGAPSTAQEFIRRAKEGYYEAMKGFPDRKARREWRRRFRRQMRGRTCWWQHGWQNYWAPPVPQMPPAPPVPPHPGFPTPFLSLLHGAAKILWICALISLLATGAVFGMELPGNMPTWVAALLLCAAYGIIVAPLKVARRACCYWGSSQPNWNWSFMFLLDALLSILILVVALWLAIHFFTELREAVRTLPALLHQAAADIRSWWKDN